MNRVIIYDRKFGKNEQQFLAVKIDEGNLVFEGHDLGDSVKEYWGDFDYEYWLRVEAEHLPKLLLELIKETFIKKIFTNDSEFKEWLKTKGIPSQFDSWV